ncbi:hypothetical protein [Natrinema salinisoli]|nr:hypothetical protein [Natrinema salinisoli]
MYRNEDGELMMTKEDDIVLTFLACDVAEFLLDVLGVEPASEGDVR